MPVKLGTALPEEIPVFDLETTGVDVETDRIVTAFIGVMDTATGEVVERHEWLVNPGVEIPKGASDVHGITNEKAIAEGMDAKQAVFQILQRLDIVTRHGAPLVIMNAPFDLTMLDREVLRHWGTGIRPLMAPGEDGRILHPIVFDPMVLDRAVDKYRRGKRTLVDLAAVYGVPVEANAHDAEADCRMAGRVAIKLMGHSRLADLTPAEVHVKLIATHRNQGISLADFWKTGKGLEGKTPDERREAIRSVEENAGLWPMRPRPATNEGASA